MSRGSWIRQGQNRHGTIQSQSLVFSKTPSLPLTGLLQPLWPRFCPRPQFPKQTLRFNLDPTNEFQTETAMVKKKQIRLFYSPNSFQNQETKTIFLFPLLRCSHTFGATKRDAEFSSPFRKNLNRPSFLEHFSTKYGKNSSLAMQWYLSEQSVIHSVCMHNNVWSPCLLDLLQQFLFCSSRGGGG